MLDEWSKIIDEISRRRQNQDDADLAELTRAIDQADLSSKSGDDLVALLRQMPYSSHDPRQTVEYERAKDLICVEIRKRMSH